MHEHISSGRALAKFAEMVAAQGGDLDRLPPMPSGVELVAEQSGYIGMIDAEALGLAIIELGGGRKVMTDKINPSVGLEMLVRLGDKVDAGQPTVRVFAPENEVDRARPIVHKAIAMHDKPPAIGPLIVERLE